MTDTHTHRELGSSGLEISPIGLGTWALGGSGWQGAWGEQDDARSLEAIREALAGGVNWIDTAPVYGLGHAEVVIGRALKEIPEAERPLVFTKCGFEWSEDDPDDIWQSLKPERIREELDESLGRLGLERIDLLQIHWPDFGLGDDGESASLEESWAAMAELVEAGKAAAIGVSNFSVEDLERCEKIRHVDSVQPPFSMIGRTALDDVIPWAREHRTGVLAYSPMQSGLLTDRASLEWAASFADDDWRRDAPEFKSPRLERNLALRDALKPIAERHQCSVASVALAWVLAQPGLSGAIVGGRSAEQVRGWLPAAAIALDETDLGEIAEAIDATRAGEDWTVYPNPAG